MLITLSLGSFAASRLGRVAVLVLALVGLSAGPLLAPADAASNYEATIMADHPTSYWPLTDPAGSVTAQDLQGITQGTVEGGVTPAAVPGPIAGTTAFSFDGQSCSGVNLNPAATGLATPAMSVEAWVQSTNASDGIVFRWRSHGYGLYPTGFSLYPGGNGASASISTTPVGDGAWHYIVGTYDGSNIDFYVDGVLAASTPASGSPQYDSPGYVAIGRDANACDGVVPSFEGNIAQVAAYDYALSAAQVAAHYAAANGAAASAATSTTTVDHVFDLAGGLTTFTDAPLANLSQYAATIEWGDDSTSSGTVGNTLTPGQYEVSGLHTYLLAGTYTIKVAIDKNGQPFATRMTTATILPTHFRVEFKSWIPQPVVVDPENPIAKIPPALRFPPFGALCETGLGALDSTVTYLYNGNDHTGFAGSFKVDMPVEFNWNGSTISYFQVGTVPSVPGENVGHVGTTHHLITQEPLFGSNKYCEETATATDNVGSHNTGASGSTFTAEYTVKDPLVGPAPPLQMIAKGTVAPNGDLTLALHQTLFPSAGVEVLDDGQGLGTKVYNDASCLSNSAVLGPGGAAALAFGLYEHDDDLLNFQIGDPLAFDSTPVPSPVCNPGYVITDPLPLGRAVIARAPAAPAGVQVLPINSSTGKPGRPLSLTAAIAAGLAQTATDGTGHTMLITSLGQPVDIRMTGHTLAFSVQVAQSDGASRTAFYGPISGPLTIAAATTGVTTTRRGRKLKAHPTLLRPPITSVAVTGHGHSMTLHFRVRAQAPLRATYVIVNGRRRTLRGSRLTLRLTAHEKLVVSYFSVDVFGDVGKQHSLTLKR